MSTHSDLVGKTLVEAPFALSFSGQGYPWLPTLKENAVGQVYDQVADIIDKAAQIIEPLADRLAGTRPHGFKPFAWDEDASVDYAASAVSVPGIFLSQIATFLNLQAQGVDLSQAVAVIGHSQGVLGVELQKNPENAASLLAIAQLIGAALTRTATEHALVRQGESTPMLSIRDISREELEAAIAKTGAAIHIGLRNTRNSFVAVAKPEDLEKLIAVLKKLAERSKKEVEDKLRGGAPFAPKCDFLNVSTAFHHPQLAGAVEQVAQWAQEVGLDSELARYLAQRIIVDPIDWLEDVRSAVHAGAEWIFDLGPDKGVDALNALNIQGYGVGTLSLSTNEGQTHVFTADVEKPRPWSDFAPQLVAGEKGPRLSTAFTRLTGRSPMMLPGMTPTTVDPEIVAAAANGGHWAEMAGGGQVTPDIFNAHLEKLKTLLKPGVNIQFNSMFLDPYLWKLHIAGTKLVSRARANGAPIDGLVITAGMPDHDEALSLIERLRGEGFSWISFKPGAVKHIKKVLDIARAIPDFPIIMQVEGGKAGGHHSWEDLDELLISTYAEIRTVKNIILCVGGGIATPEQAADYIDGSWAHKYDLPAMPVDAILLGTVAMATKEAKTSPSVKKLLRDTQGTAHWVGAGHAVDGMASGRSQLGADIHEIDNSAARAGRLLDEVAGDEEAVAARREEIIAAIAQTAKPYFGDVDAMSYQQWLERYLELSGPWQDRGWTDPSWFVRYQKMVERVEARLSERDHGEIELKVVVDEKNPAQAIADLAAHYDISLTVHPADRAWFLNLARTPGKPVNFVPVIDKDVRRWWRSDSLWQAQDERYDADQVCIIPGISAVAGIDRIDEPVADLLDRFNAAAIERLSGSDIHESDSLLERIIKAPSIRWVDRDIPSLIHRVAPVETWTITGKEAQSTQGAICIDNGDGSVTFTVKLGVNDTVLRIRLQANPIPGASPIVSGKDAQESMGELTRIAAGGTLAQVTDSVAEWTTTFSAAQAADYKTVTAGMFGADLRTTALAPDVLVGYAWPAIFAAVSDARIPESTYSVVEGMLNLVHLEHTIELLTEELPQGGEALRIRAQVENISDTNIGRIIFVRAEIFANERKYAVLEERFAVRGRNGEESAENSTIMDTVVDRPRSFRAATRLHAPENMRPFAVTSGDHNPIHVSIPAAQMAGLSAPIVHGMWTSAIAQLAAIALKDEKIAHYSAQMLAPIALGAQLDITVVRKGVDTRVGFGEVREITVHANGETALIATAIMREARTFYAFPGQGIQSQGMGMDAYTSSAAAREIWDRADKHTRAQLGFSILEIVRNNPTEVVVHGERFYHPQGVLFLTQFTQVGMATLGVAQIAQLREAYALNEKAFFAGHSVGEYNALAAYAGTLSLEAVVEIVYRRGLTMHRLVVRDENGESNYGLAALRPNKMGLNKDTVADFVAQISAQTGEFLEIVNYNIAGVQYAVAGTTKGLKALAAEAEKRAPGQRAFIKIPGIDVPFHSSKLRNGVDDFRAHLDRLLPQELNLDVLIGRYIPNLVARPFEVSADFVQAMKQVVEHPILDNLYEQLSTQPAEDVSHEQLNAYARTILVELLAWQFASPVRWIETQDLALTGLNIERFVEVGVGSSPTVANMFGQTLRLPQYQNYHPEVLNIERDAATVFATDEIPLPEVHEDTDSEENTAADASAPAENTPVAPAEPVAPAAPAAASVSAGSVADIPFTAADATEMLIAHWTKVRPDQMSSTDTIEALVEGVSSRRNQLLLDLGVEFGLGAIDGAADAELAALKAQINGMAKGYSAFGPVLSDVVADSLRALTGPSGKKPQYVAQRVTDTWGLGQGWADHTVATLVLGTREGASLRGGDLALFAHSNLDELIDAALNSVAAQQGISISMPGNGGSSSGVVDSAVLNEYAEFLTGDNGVLATTARTLLRQLGLEKHAETTENEENSDLFDTVSRELGSDWPRVVAPRFSAEKAVLFDDRWASAREDLVRIITGQTKPEECDFTGAGDIVAAQAQYWASTRPEYATIMDRIAQQATDTRAGAYAQDIAVVTGASPHSIAAAVVGELLAGGATVITTTSSLNHDRVEFYKKLYRTHARGGAALWVIPANLSSYTDVDAVINWIGTEQTATVNGAKKLIKPAYVPTVLFPFAAPRVQGTLADAGPQAENQMRLLLWSVEKLIAGLSELGQSTHVGQRLHVVIPGSPNRGRFGGDGAYGESKAALDALVTRWNAEPVWGTRTSLVHALIGWVRGTGLMGGNDRLVSAVEKAGVTTYSTEEIAQKLIECISEENRSSAAQSPFVCDFTGGLGQADINLAELARQEAASAHSTQAEEETVARTAALPNIETGVAENNSPQFSHINQKLEDMVVIVGAGELGPYGSSRTRFEAELTGDLSAAGVIELAWSMKLISYDNGWVDADGNEINEEEIYERYHDEVLARVGVRRYHDDFGMINNLAPELTTVYLDHDMEFGVADKETALTYQEADAEQTDIYFDEAGQEWKVIRKAGSAIRVPRRIAMSRFVGGQIPEGFDPTVYGIPADMVDNLDRVALWNLVCTVDAFLSAGFSPAELLAHLHPVRISSTQGTGMGGMESMRSLYIDRLLAHTRANDILQEALPNVVAAHVMQSYIGGYGQMIHPVAACATAAVSVEEGSDKIQLGKADFVVAGGIDDLSVEGITGFGDMAATADSNEMHAKGIDDRYFSRANDRRRGGFIESAGGGTILLARASLAYELGLPVLGVVAYAQSFADGAHTSIPAPGLGALGAACGGSESVLARSLADLDVSADEVGIISKHDTSTNANDPNESELHESIAAALGRSEGNPLYVISQKSLTGHAKGGAAAFQIIGLTQVLSRGIIPPNRSLDCVDPVLAKNKHLVWLRDSLTMSSKAGFVTSLGFGHVSALVAIVHPAAFDAAVAQQRGAQEADTYKKNAQQRLISGARRITDAIYGGPVLYQRPVERNLGKNAKQREREILVDPQARIF